MLLNCGVGEDSWESRGLQGDPTSSSKRRSVLCVHWKDWRWSWNSNTLATWCEELTHWKIPWCWERLRTGGEGDDRVWGGWMASPTQWTWVWCWWWAGRPGVLHGVTKSQTQLSDWTEPAAQFQKNKRPNKKLGQRTKQTFLQRTHTDDLQTQGRMLNITHYDRNANENHNVLPYHTGQNGCYPKFTNNKCWKGCGEKGTLLHCWWECKPKQPRWRTVWRFLKKLEMELPSDSAIPLLGMHNEETRIERDTCTPMFITALFIIARKWKQPRCSSAEKWIRKLWYIYTMEYYPDIIKNTFASILMMWMKLEPIRQSEVSQKEKCQYSILMHIYRI